MPGPHAAGRPSWRGHRGARGNTTNSSSSVQEIVESAPQTPTPQSLTPRSSQASLCEDPAELEVLNELLRRRFSTQSTVPDGKVAADDEASAIVQEAPARPRRSRWGNTASTGSSKEQKHVASALIEPGAGKVPSASKTCAAAAKSSSKKEKSEKPSILDDFHRLKSEFQVAKVQLQTLMNEPATPSPRPCRDNSSSPLRSPVHSSTPSRSDSPLQRGNSSSSKFLSATPPHDASPARSCDSALPHSKIISPADLRVAAQPDEYMSPPLAEAGLSPKWGSEGCEEFEARTSQAKGMDKDTSQQKEPSKKKAPKVSRPKFGKASKAKDKSGSQELVGRDASPSGSSSDGAGSPRGLMTCNVDELWEPETQPDPHPQETPQDANDVIVEQLTQTFGEPRSRGQEFRKLGRSIDSVASELSADTRGLNAASPGENVERIRQDLELVEQQLAAARSQAERIEQQRHALLERARLEQLEEPGGMEVELGAPCPEPSSASWAGLESEPSFSEYAQDSSWTILDGHEHEQTSVKQTSRLSGPDVDAAALQIQAFYRGCRARTKVAAERARLSDSWEKVRGAEARIDEMLKLFGAESPIDINGLAAVNLQALAIPQPRAAPQLCALPQQTATVGPVPQRKLSSKRGSPSVQRSTIDRGKNDSSSDGSQRALRHPLVIDKHPLHKPRGADPKETARITPLATPRTTPPATPRGSAAPSNAGIEFEEGGKQPGSSRRSSTPEILPAGMHVYPRARKFAKAAAAAAAAASHEHEDIQEPIAPIVVYPRARRSATATDVSPRIRRSSTASRSAPSNDAEATPKKPAQKPPGRRGSAPAAAAPSNQPGVRARALSQQLSQQVSQQLSQQPAETDSSVLEDTGVLTPRSGPQPHPYPTYRPSFRALQAYLPAPPDSAAARATNPAPEVARAPSRASSRSITPPAERPPAPTRTPPRNSLRTPPRTPPRTLPRRASESGAEQTPSSATSKPSGTRSGSRVRIKPPVSPDDRPEEPPPPPWSSSRHAMASSDEEMPPTEVGDQSRIPQPGRARTASIRADAHRASNINAPSQRIAGSTKIQSQRASAPTRQEALPSAESSSDEELVVVKQPAKRSSKVHGSQPLQRRPEKFPSSKTELHGAESVSSTTVSESEAGRSRPSKRSSSSSSTGSRQTAAVKTHPSGRTGPSSDDMAFGFPDGQVYMGFRNKNGGREGFGVMRCKDGQMYTGQWQNGKRNGQGTLFFENGVFEGQWVDDYAHGVGTISHKNGDIFKGEYKNNKKCGPGTYTWKDGSEEKGDYVDGQRHGWHYLRRDGEDWDIFYEEGNMVSASKRGSTMLPAPAACASVAEPFAEDSSIFEPAPAADQAPPELTGSHAVESTARKQSEQAGLAAHATDKVPNFMGSAAKQRLRGSAPLSTSSSGQRSGIQKSSSSFRTSGRSLASGGRSSSRLIS